MAKNSKMMKNVNQNVAEAAEAVVLKVTRELLDVKTASGADMYAYVLREKCVMGEVEREVKVEFVVPSVSGIKDMAGYEMLDIIFMFGDDANLSIEEKTRVDQNTGEVSDYKVYEIWNEDKDGIKYRYNVQPSRASDKAKLDFILQKKKLELEKATASATKNNKTEG